MNEEELNQDNNTQEEIAEETLETVKESAKLAKNVATANPVGIAKNTIKLTKNKQFKKMLIIKIIAPIIILVMLILCVYSIFNKIGDAVKDVVDGIVDFFTFDSDGAIKVEEEQVDKIIESITSLGIDLKDIKLMGDVDYSKENIEEENEKALKKYVKKFLEAQAMTQTINPNPGFIDKQLHSYGTVYVYRTKDTTNDVSNLKQIEQMEYIEYKDMVELCEGNGNVNKIRNKYSINPDTGELVVAGWSTTTTTVEGTTSNIYLRSINYKNAISQFTTPVTFLIYLTMITQNPEFVSEVVDLIQDGEIRIAVMDNVTTDIEETTHKYVKNTETVTATSGKVSQSSKQNVDSRTGATLETETTTVKTVSYNPTIAITKVKTWFCEQEITYKRKKSETSNSSNSSTIENEQKPETTGTGTVSWKTDQTVTTKSTTTMEGYEEGVRGDVIDRTGEKGDDIRYKNGEIKEQTFIGLLDTKFKIPNSKREEKAGGNFKSGAEWFLELLQKDPSCQRLDQVIRYILYKYTGKDYGVTDASIFQMFNAELNPISRDIIVDTKQCAPELVIKDIKTLKKAFKGYSGNSELINNAQAFLDMQNRYHVNALFAAAVSITETSAGRAGNATNGANNWFNIRGTNTTWAQYSSPKEGIMKFGWQIAEGGYYFTSGNYSVATIGKVYCPNTATHPDQADKWIENTIGYMVDFYEAAGIDISEFLGGDAAGVVNFALQFVGQGHKTFTSYKTSDGKQFWGDEWCAMFVSYCFDNCGAIPNILKRSFTGVPSEWEYYKTQGKAHIKGTYTPKPGDLAIFANGNSIAHVGIVTKYDGTYVHTVEGNTRNDNWRLSIVKVDKYTMSSGWLYGFVEL